MFIGCMGNVISFLLVITRMEDVSRVMFLAEYAVHLKYNLYLHMAKSSISLIWAKSNGCRPDVCQNRSMLTILLFGLLFCESAVNEAAVSSECLSPTILSDLWTVIKERERNIRRLENRKKIAHNTTYILFSCIRLCSLHIPVETMVEV